MNLKLKAALYTIIPYFSAVIWLFSLIAWYEPTFLFTLFFLWFIALPFAIYNIIYSNLKYKQNSVSRQKQMKDLLDANKRASDKVQQTIDAMRGKND